MDLQRSAADWKKLFREIGFYLGRLKKLRDAERYFSLKRARIQIVEEHDDASSTSSWVLAGVKFGTNTDEDGIIYVRITDETPVGGATVNLYKAAGGGGGDLVATGNGANGATITLAASNSSGLTGTVVLGTVGASESDDRHRLRPFPDAIVQALTVFDGTEREHADLRRGIEGTCVASQNLMAAAITSWVAQTMLFLSTRWATFHRSGASGPVNNNPKNDDGLVTITYNGTLEDGRKNMVDETATAAQTLRKNVVAVAAPVQRADNQGLVTITTPSVSEWARPGTLTLTVDDDTIGSTRWVAYLKESVSDRVFDALNNVQIKREFADPVLGIRGLLISAKLTLDAGAANDFGTASPSPHVITGETDSNTNDGVLYVKIVAGTINPALFKVQYYSGSSYGTSTLVAESDEGAANATPGINPKNSSGLGGTAKIGAAPTAGNTGTLNLNPPRRQGSASGVADSITIELTVTSRGEFQTRLADAFNYALNSATSGSETIPEGYATVGSFVPYETPDLY